MEKYELDGLFSLLVIHVEGPQSRGVEVNGSVVLTCLFEAGNPVDIVWVKDGVHLLVAVEVLGREPHCSEGVFNYCLESG